MTVPASVVRRFSVEEANRTLPLVRMVVGDIVELYTDLQRRRERLGALRSRQGGKARAAHDLYEQEVMQMELELEVDAERYQGYLDELTQIGVELKDPALGLVDFRGTLEGRDVYLCWKLGEEFVSHWHPLDAGSGDRRSLLEGVASGGKFETPELGDESN